jgi:predicted alpha/beta hydrolase
MKPGPQYDAQSAEIGNVSTTLEGVTYTGFYRVRAQGKGKQRYHVTADKRVTVDYKGQTKYTSVGMRGLQWTAEALLSELVSASERNQPASGFILARS